ncbi:ParA family protein [Deinococcus sp. Marseille-Q6407]|uniref:ParA family protein n=1 Tax=Deinococcus sp. Marseille-Q6407 TaxID=2969223 RepID=UPI0021BFA975|nr:ParA family protein [Deinococcus sp. Marseille-Q6407]
MIIGILSRKGGVGKTTLAVHLAGLLAQEDTTVLVDEDDTRNATTWAARGELPFTVVGPAGMARAARAHEHIVVDSRGGMNSDDMQGLYEGADRIVVPVSNEYMALDTLIQTADILRQVDPELEKLRVVMTMVKKGRKLNDAREALGGLGLMPVQPTVRFSEAFRDASAGGVLVRDVTGNRLAKNCWGDVREVLQAVRA